MLKRFSNMNQNLQLFVHLIFLKKSAHLFHVFLCFKENNSYQCLYRLVPLTVKTPIDCS